MKKFYNEPEMNISMFEVENVVTGSGDPETNPQTAVDYATDALNTAGSTQIATVTWTF